MSASIRLIAASLVVGALVIACAGSGGPGSSPAPSATIGPTAGSLVPATPGPPGGLPSGECVPSASACATASPAATPLAGFACPLASTTIAVPSNRLTGVVVTPRDGYDEVAFEFGQPGSGSGVAPQLTIGAATPPFVAGASGQPLTVAGQTFVALTFHDMIVADDAGKPTNAGPTSITPSTSGVRQVVQSEAFEGVIGWIVGSSAPGCVRVRSDAASSRILVDVQGA